jgi:hypothetical protein
MLQRTNLMMSPAAFADFWDDVAASGRGHWEHRAYRAIEQAGFIFDYDRLIKELNLVERRNNGEFDEVWMVGFMSGAYETVMIGRGAYWINGIGIEADCEPFRISSINRTRFDTPLENLAHSAESILSKIYNSHRWTWDNRMKLIQEMDTWERFTVIDRRSPGNAAVGYSHFAPNSQDDYDWGNTTYVYSSWRDWVNNFPNLTGQKELVNVTTWHTGTCLNRDWHTWWFTAFPHVQGRDAKGFSHNWWIYFQTFVYTTDLEIKINRPASGIGIKIDGLDNVDIQVLATLTNRSTIDVTSDSTIQISNAPSGKAHITAWRDGVSVNITVEPDPIIIDESVSPWAESYVRTALEKDLIPETLQDKYTTNITRAEYAALAVILYENLKGEIKERIEFVDTDDINIKKAAAIGVVNGVGNNRFDPDANLTREQAAVMLARLANVIDHPLPKETTTFRDIMDISDWAIEAVGQVQATGIMSGVGNNRFAPKELYTREQSIITIIRLYNFIN